MWPTGYFASSYWAQTYWGRLGPAAPPSSTVSRTLALLQPPASVLYPHRGEVWRATETYDSVGKPNPRAWRWVYTSVPLYVQSNPSQFELQQFILGEGDNIFTLDIGHFPDTVDIRDGDELLISSGPTPLLGGCWKIRGDFQSATWAAGKKKYVMARLAQPSFGVG